MSDELPTDRGFSEPPSAQFSRRLDELKAALADYEPQVTAEDLSTALLDYIRETPPDAQGGQAMAEAIKRRLGLA
ncbi:hypothetical protein KBB96_10240 [Luteolibacter ambystomatis]|uniref:Uncharacterized protein n=1 Tax=Luteolibacter ambystomatis TaxID=2824561 RepID=A0A975G5N4_9BACT|nr:hypothetical protein [Luteolibacter ambystomatis]QUE49252.1 hypothetical protein KBB96_10240 [Luteolibacter ambystomatis]